MEKEKKPSEELQHFISFLEEAKTAYETAKKKLSEYDSMERHIYWAHKFELAKDRNERNRLATAYQRERIERRHYKDICVRYEALHDFTNSESNKRTLKSLRGVVQRQEKQENYLESERTYKRGDSSDTDQ